MFGDANKSKEFKTDEINGVKIKGLAISQQRRPSCEFFSPIKPIDQGFSFYEAYSQIPILEFKGEEFSAFKDYETHVPTEN